MFFVVVFVFSCLGKEQTRKEFSPLSKSLLKGAYFFFLGRKKEEHFFESFLDPQISFARII